jgi:glycosyltransferase involved in cell wall biosynthesis
MNETEQDSKSQLRISHFCFALDRTKGGGAGGVILTAMELTKFGILNEIYSSGNTRKQLASNSSTWTELHNIGVNVIYSISPVKNDYGLGIPFGFFSKSGRMQKSSLVILHQVYTLSTFIGFRYAMKNQIPYAVFPHGSLTHYHEANNTMIKKIAKKVIITKILQKADRIIVTCESEKEDLHKSIRSKAVLLPYGAEIKMDLLGNSNKSRSNGNYLRVLFSGRFDRKKNLRLLLEAMPLIVSKYPELILDIAGSGSRGETEVLIKFAQELNVANNVIFHGWMKKSEVENLLNSAQLLVLPSENENFAQVVSEALSHGVPCVVSKFVGTSDIVAKHHAGEIIQELTPESVAAAVLTVLGGDKLGYREAALSAAREDLDWSKIALKWKLLVASLA